MNASPPALATPEWPEIPSDNTAALRKMMLSVSFGKIIENVPRIEIEHLYTLTGVSRYEKDPTDMAILFCFLRLSERACNTCKIVEKTGTTPLLWCSACKVTFYCSSACQEKDWGQHSRWCCNQHAEERDCGPMKIEFISTYAEQS